MISKLDLFISMRLMSRVLGVIFLFSCLIFLSESLDSGRFARISSISGPGIAWLAAGTATIRWSIKTLSITVLIGAIIALLEFRNHREFVVMKASGISVWRILRAPLICMVVFGVLITTVAEGLSTRVNREINPTPPGLGGGISRATSDIWLQQEGDDGPYKILAGSTRENGSVLHDVQIFNERKTGIRRISAQRAELRGGKWILISPVLIRADGSRQVLERFEVATGSNAADLRVTLGSTEDFTYFELIDVLTSGVNDPAIRAAAATRLAKLTSLPLLLVGSLLIAFAFTAGYRRGGSLGRTIVYGIVTGFVVFVITEMADRAGSSGVLDPAFATWGPAWVSVLIGLSVLLQKEDGRL